jgi:transposase
MHDDSPPPLLSARDWAALSPEGQAAILSLVDMVRSLSAEVVQLRAQVNDLQARLQQTSQNSSKPPSSDPPSAPPRPYKTPRGRPRGGQPGHPGHDRPLAPPEQVDTIVPLYPVKCPTCLAHFPPTLPDVAPLLRTQIWDLPARLIHVTQYQQHTVACPCCGQIQQAAAPAHLPPGVFGPGVVALTALLRRYRMSEREIVDCWQTVFGLPISLGSVVRQCQRVCSSLDPLDAAIRTSVQEQPALNADATAWREKKRRAWLWTATTPNATSFRIDPARSRTAFEALVPPPTQGSSARIGTAPTTICSCSAGSSAGRI